MPNKNDYIRQLRAIQHATGWNQQTLAKEIGVSEKQMTFWVQGHASVHRIEFREKISELYFKHVLKQETMF